MFTDVYLKHVHKQKEIEREIGHILYCKIETKYRLGSTYEDICKNPPCLTADEISYVLDDILLWDEQKTAYK